MRPADALLQIHSHLKGLGFQDTPDYGHLRACLQQLPDEQVTLQLQHLIPQQGQHNGSLAAQQQAWDNSPLGQQLPTSPFIDASGLMMSPVDSQGAAAAGGWQEAMQRASRWLRTLTRALLLVDCKQLPRRLVGGSGCDGHDSDNRPQGLTP